jgi:uncharacterized protein (TIGR04255 family)
MNDLLGTTTNPYTRPPITEAVVELRFAAPQSIDHVEKVKSQLAGDYSLPPQALQSLTISPGASAPTLGLEGYRLFSADAANIAIISRSSISSSRLAPYTGWEDLVGRARANWAVWKRVAGWQQVARVGVRYINRIDVPNPGDMPISIDNYLLFKPVFPMFEGHQPVDTFAINASMGVANSGFRLILNAGVTASPLVKTTSFLLDIDISQESDLPNSDDALWLLIEQIRNVKNRVFEASITDAARKLFSS